MAKYNYKKASELWQKMIDIIWDMPDYLDTELRQTERRYFLRMLTHNEIKKINAYIDYLSQFIEEMDAGDQDRTALEKITLQIATFTN